MTERGRRRDGMGARAWHVLLLLTLGCAGDGPTGPSEPIRQLPRALSESELGIIGASNAFAADLLGQVHAADPDSTVFLSPLSASFALGMTMNGAGGQTRSQMHDMLHFGDLTTSEVNASYRDLMALLGTLDPRVELGLANAAFHRDTFSVEPAFTQTLDDYFGAHVRGLDFDDPASVQTMNDWVRQQTANRIEKVLEPPIDPTLMLFLMNAIWFKGDWTGAFDAADSYDGTFTGPAGPATARFMTKEDSLGYRAADAWEAVEIPYGGGAWTMVVALPFAGHTLADVVADMNDLLDPAADWPGATIALHLPSFELEWERTLTDDLRALGMVDAFHPHLADLSGINPTVDDLFVHFVKQNTYLRVDEVGTEAAAVTTVGIGVECACGPPDFRADRPFFLAIRERLSGTVLFTGLIVQPPAL